MKNTTNRSEHDHTRGLSTGALRAGALAGALLALTFAEGLPARAQDALGTGHALDANPLVGSGGRNRPVRDFERELRFREAVVTGNVAGGFAFRDFVGYSASGDFTGELGSDDLFEFERDSLFSGLAARNVRGISALQSVLALSTGGLPDMETASAFVVRPGRGMTASDLRMPTDAMEGLDPFTMRSSSLRSTSDHLVSAATQPIPFGVSERQDGRPMLVSSSPLRGVYWQTLPDGIPGVSAPATPGAPGTPGAPADPARRASPDRIESTRVDGRVPSDGRRADPLTARVDPVRTTYESVLREYSARPLAPLDPEPRDADVRPERPAEPALPEQIEDSFEADERFMDRIEALRRKLLFVDEPVDGEEEETRTEFERQTAELFRGVAPRIDRFIDPAETPDAYHRHIRDGQAALAAGRWFTAEEAFTIALTRRPGDPIASAGRVNAQLGAGMVLSAAVNLRSLLRAHPEMIPVRYGDELLPREPRRTEILEMLRTESQRDDNFGRDAGLLLAYAGRQFGTQEDVRAGLDAVARVDRYFAADPDPLTDALRAVWRNNR
ncbi:MAG: hypothetical protein EA379_04325 [Phycisphaerales bacterium]|nr:MAG: hypothetical protein EA379_04325 [Phycisphaerales bacterium]